MSEPLGIVDLIAAFVCGGAIASLIYARLYAPHDTRNDDE